MKLHIQVGLMMIWCSRSAALVPECTGKPSSLRWQSRRPPGMELCCTKQERMSLRNNIKRAAQTSWKFAYSLSIKLTKAIGVFLGDSFGHHASLIDVFQRSQRVSFFQKDGFSWYWYLYFDLQQASVLPERRLDVLGVMQMGQQVKSLIISWSLVPWTPLGLDLSQPSWTEARL